MSEQILIESKVFQGLTFIVETFGNTTELTCIHIQVNRYHTIICRLANYNEKTIDSEDVNHHPDNDNDRNYKYIINDSQVDCMTFINAYEEQAPIGFNIVIDRQNKIFKLVHLKCVGCIFVDYFNCYKQEYRFDIIKHIDTCVDCYYCVNCMFCKNCNHCTQSKYLENCDHCYKSSNCYNCSDVSRCTFCNSCNHCFDCDYSSNVNQSRHVEYSKKCKDSKAIQFSKHVNRSRQVLYSNKIYNSDQIYFSTSVNTSKKIRYSDCISVCYDCLKSSICYKSKVLESVDYIKFSHECRYCNQLYSCVNCHHSDNLFFCNAVHWSWMCFMTTNSVFSCSIMNCAKALFCQKINKWCGNDYFTYTLHLQDKVKHSYTVRDNNFDSPSMTRLLQCTDEILTRLNSGDLLYCIDAKPTGLKDLIQYSQSSFNKNLIEFANTICEQKKTMSIQELNKKIDNVYDALTQIKSMNNLMGFYKYSSDKKYTKPRHLLINDNLAIAIQDLFTCYDDISYAKLIKTIKLKPLIAILVDITVDTSESIMYCNECTDMYESDRCSHCNHCENCNQCNYCIFTKQCKFTYYVDNCDNCSQCNTLSYCKDISNMSLKYNNEQITISTCNDHSNVIDCPCGCGKRIEIDSNNFYRVYDKDNYLVYIGTRHIGYIYHEMSYQVYKKCYFKIGINVKKYFENDEYFVSKSTNNCYYVETYDRNGSQVSCNCVN